MKHNNVEKGTYLVVGPLAPPTTGVTHVNATIQEQLINLGFQVVSLDVSPKKFYKKTIKHHIERIRAYIRVVRAVLVMRSKKKCIAWPALVHLEGGYGIVYSAIVCLALKGCKSVTLYHHTGWYFRRRSHLVRMLLKVAPNCSHVVADEAMKKALRELYFVAPDSVSVVENSAYVELPHVDVKLYQARRSDRYVMGYISYVSIEKGIDEAIKLFHKMRIIGSKEMVLRVAGRAEEGAGYRILLEAVMNSQGSVEYLGEISSHERDEFYRSIDVLIFPSRLDETQSLVIPEAQSFGVPVIARDVGFVSSAVKDTESKLVPRTADFVETASRIIEAWSKDADSMKIMSENVRMAFDVQQKRANRRLQALLER